MKLKKFFKYHKQKLEKDLLEELLKKKKNFFIKQHYESYKRNYLPQKQLETIFKSIGYRKSYNSLRIAMNYLLKNTNQLENEMGQIITQDLLQHEIYRLDIKRDEDNLKNNINLTTKIKDSDLKNRQIWHAMFSLPNNKKENKVLFKQVIREALSNLLPGHRYIFAIHENTQYMHCHLIIKTKNEFTNKQIRINPPQLKHFHDYIHKKCIDHQLDLTSCKNTPKVKKHRLSTIYNKVENWKKMYTADQFKKLSVNPSVYKKLMDLGMKDKDLHSFLNMYRENKSLAIWTVNNNSKLFNIKKPATGFTLRKVTITEKAYEVSDRQ